MSKTNLKEVIITYLPDDGWLLQWEWLDGQNDALSFPLFSELSAYVEGTLLA